MSCSAFRRRMSARGRQEPRAAVNLDVADGWESVIADRLNGWRLWAPFTARAAGPTGYSACPGGTTMHGCWLAASLAQAALAALADRLPSRARYTTLPPKGEVGRSSI